YEIKELMRTILASRHFYSGHAFRRRIKGPVEYVLGAVRSVYRSYRDDQPEYRPLHHRALVARLGAMGQHLFAPPNVKGWPGGPAWLNTSTLLERSNFAGALATGALWTDATRDRARQPTTADDPAPPPAYDPARLLAEERIGRREDVVPALLDLHLPGGVRPQ